MAADDNESSSSALAGGSPATAANAANPDPFASLQQFLPIKINLILEITKQTTKTPLVPTIAAADEASSSSALAGNNGGSPPPPPPPPPPPSLFAASSSALAGNNGGSPPSPPPSLFAAANAAAAPPSLFAAANAAIDPAADVIDPAADAIHPAADAIDPAADAIDPAAAVINAAAAWRTLVASSVSIAIGVLVIYVVAGTVGFGPFQSLLGRGATTNSFVDALYFSVSTLVAMGYVILNALYFVLYFSVSTLVAMCYVLYFVLYFSVSTLVAMCYVLFYALYFSVSTIVTVVAMDKSEFVVYKLKEMGKVSEKDIKPICDQFDRLDSGNCGKITLSDLLSSHHH